MSETEDDSSSNSSSDDDDSSNSSEEEEEEEEHEDSSDDEVIELIQVGDVRTAFSMATGGKNCCTLDQFPSVLNTLNIKLNEKRTVEFFTMLDEDATNEVGWNAMFYALRDGQSKFKGLPMDQVVGGLLYEFAASARGRKMKEAVAKKSMISFMETTGTKMTLKTDTSEATLNIPTKQSSVEKPSGLSKPTRSAVLSSSQRQSSIPEDEEEDQFDTNNSSVKPSSGPFASAFSVPIGGRTRAGTVQATLTSSGSSSKGRSSLKSRISDGHHSRGMSQVTANQHEKLQLKNRTSRKLEKQEDEDDDNKLDIIDTSKIKGPIGEAIAESLKQQQESLNDLYAKVGFFSQTLREKYKNQDLVNGMNNVVTLQNAINGIAKSSVASLKSDMNDVLNKSAIHSSHQVANEISSQLKRMNHTINNTNKILSAQSGNNFNDKLENLEDYLNSIDLNNAQMMMPGAFNNNSRPTTAISTYYSGYGLGVNNTGSGSYTMKSRLNSAKSFRIGSGHQKDKQSLVHFEFDEKTLDQFGVNGLDKEDVQPIIDDMESIKKSITSMDDCLQKIISDRLLKLEKTVFALFGQIASNKKDTYQLMPVEELATQLDLQKSNFEAQIRKSQLKITELEKLLKHQKDSADREKQAAQDERERLLIALGRFLQQESVVNELRGELKKKLGKKFKDSVEKNNEENNKQKEDDNNNNNKEEDDDKEDEKENKKNKSLVDIISADKHLELNNYEPNSKYDKETANYEKKLHDHHDKLQMKALKSILEYKSLDDIPKIDDDEIPDFLLNESDDNLYDNDKELEEQLGFGYEELLRIYRANTNLNVQLSFLKWERDELREELNNISQPIIINTIGKSTEIALQLKLQSYIDQINSKQLELINLKGQKKKIGIIDKYRLEMYRDAKKDEMEIRRDLREDKLEILRQKRMIKKLFEQTKQKASKIMAEANELRKSVKDEIEEYQKKKHEMVLARAKYEDKMNKNKVEMEQQIINEEVEKHIEIYKQHLEDEAQEKAQEQLEEDLESEKEILLKQFNEKMEELNEDIEKERVEHEKEIKRLKNEIKQQQNRMEETTDAQQKYMMRTNEIRKEKSKLQGQVKELQLLLKETRQDFQKYKEENESNNGGRGGGNGGNSTPFGNGGGNGINPSQGFGFKPPQGPIDPEALYAGYYEPNEELKIARQSYKKMKMQSDQQAQQIKKLLREKAELSEKIGRLEVENETQRELVEKRDEQLIQLQSTFDTEVSSKLRPFVKLVEGVGRDVLHNAPTNYIFNYKKQDFADLEKDLYRDRSDWYIHKNHILRCYFFSIEEWFRDHFWLHERIVQCNSSVHEAMQQVLKDTWMETRIQTHAFIRWFGDLDNEQEVKLFYSVQFNNEERYFWNVDLYECVDDYRSGVIDKYYKDIVAEREERREGYWKRHPDVYSLYKTRYAETVKRYKKKLNEKKAHIDYMKKEKLDILEESDLNKIQQEFQRMKQQNQLKQMRNSQSSKPRLSNTGSSKRPNLKRVNSKSSNVSSKS